MRDDIRTHEKILHFWCSFFTLFWPVAPIRLLKNWSMSSLPEFNELWLSIGWMSVLASIPFVSRALGSFDAVDVCVLLANGGYLGSIAIIWFWNKFTCWVWISARIFARGIHNFIIVVVVAILHICSLFTGTVGSGRCRSIRTKGGCSLQRGRCRCAKARHQLPQLRVLSLLRSCL